MAYGDLYKVGTLSVGANGTAVTGTGTAWATGSFALRKGDHILAAGHRAVIEAVNSDTSLTLAIPWTEGALTNAAYVAEMDAASRNASAAVAASLQTLMDRLSRVANAGGRYTCVAVGANAPPGSPAEGQMWVIGTAPTGAWASYANYFAKWMGAAWQFWPPSPGDEAKDLASGLVWLYNSAGAWNANSLQTGALRYDVGQALTAAQRTQALANVGLTISDFAKTLLDDADAAAVLATLGLTISAYAKTLLDDADASAALSTLGVSTYIKTLLDDADAAGARATLFGDLTTDGHVLQRVSGAWTARTVSQMLATGVSYETGTFTPALSGTGVEPTVTYAGRAGNYLKIGKCVTITLWISGTHSGGTGSARINGIPFAPAFSTPLDCRPSNATAPGTVHADMLTNGTALLQYTNSSGGIGDVALSQIASGGFQIFMSGSFFVP